MDTHDKKVAKGTGLNQDQAPPRHQFLREIGRSSSPVLIYDYEQKTVQVRSKKNAGQWPFSTIDRFSS